tara:strand:+ start:164 stop:1072 length:909 start_codon:yes stop_codon:yes gene_type:complete
MPKNRKGFDPTPWEKKGSTKKIPVGDASSLSKLGINLNNMPLQGLDHLNPFPYVFKSTYDFKFQENKEKIFRNLLDAKNIIDENELRTPEQDGGITSVVLMGTGRENLDTGERTPYVPPHAWDEFKHFTTEWLPKQIDEIWKIWRLEPANKYVSESWINVHPPGAYTEEHDHQNVTIAMACYFQVPPDGGRLMMRNPMQTYKYSEPIHHTYWDINPNTGDDMSWCYLPVQTNDVVFFPGWVRHKTEPNKNKNNIERFMMSCNVRYEFKKRGSIEGMNNIPEASMSENERVTSREEYDKSIFN